MNAEKLRSAVENAIKIIEAWKQWGKDEEAASGVIDEVFEELMRGLGVETPPTPPDQGAADEFLKDIGLE